MSKERTSVVGVVVITMCLTSIGLVAGWVVLSQRLAQQTVSSEEEEAPEEEPAPRREARPRASGGAQAQPVDVSSADLAPDDARVAETEGTSAPQDDETSIGEDFVA